MSKELQSFYVPVTRVFRGENLLDSTVIKKIHRVEVKASTLLTPYGEKQRTKYAREAAFLQMCEGDSLASADEIFIGKPCAIDDFNAISAMSRVNL